MAEPLLSIVVPVLNEAADLAESLRQLQCWRPLAEVIVVDGGSEDASASVAEPLCDTLVRSQRGRALQMNAGAARAAGAYLLFLHCDTRLEITPQRLQQILETRPPWGFFRVRLSGAAPGLRLVEAGMNLRSTATAVATGDQGIFVERDVWAACGGFAPIPLMEDVELCKRLRRRASPLVVDPPVVTSSRRWEQRGVLPTVLHMWYLRLAYWLGVRPERLRRSYYG